MDSKQDALEHIAELARQHHISSEDITAFLATPTALSASPRPGVLNRILTIIGGVLVLAGLALFGGMYWSMLNGGMRVAITLGAGLSCFAAAFHTARGTAGHRRAFVLFLLAAPLEIGGAFVMLHEWFPSGSDPRYATLAILGIVYLQYITAYRHFRLSVLLFYSIALAATWFAVFFDLLDIRNWLVAIIIGSALLITAYAMRHTQHGFSMGFWYGLGSALTLAGSWYKLEGSIIELLFPGLALGLLYMSTLVRSRALLVTSVLALLGYIGHFSYEYFKDWLGWPVVLICTGIAFFTLSTLAMRLNKSYKGEFHP